MSCNGDKNPKKVYGATPSFKTIYFCLNAVPFIFQKNYPHLTHADEEVVIRFPICGWQLLIYVSFDAIRILSHGWYVIIIANGIRSILI